MCQRWKPIARCELYLHELLAVKAASGNPRGFPPQVAFEIAAIAWHPAALNAPEKRALLGWRRAALA